MFKVFLVKNRTIMRVLRSTAKDDWDCVELENKNYLFYTKETAEKFYLKLIDDVKIKYSLNNNVNSHLRIEYTDVVINNNHELEVDYFNGERVKSCFVLIEDGKTYVL